MSRKLRPLATLAMVAVISAGCSPNAPAETSSGSSGGNNTAAPAETGTGGSGGNNTAAPAETDTGSTVANKSADKREQGVKFAECMRDNGVREFPDPDASGQLTIDGVLNGSSLDPSTAAWKNAVSACKDLEPPGFTGQKRSAQEQESALKFAQCIRDNGVKDFPDPTPDGPLVDTTRIPSTDSEAGMAILNAAMEACGDLVADLVGGQP